MTEQAQTVQTQTPREVPVRQPEFGATIPDVPKWFMGDDQIVGAHLVAAMSAIFPPGEEYFVRAVERVRDRITDPELRRQVEGFIGQEDMHGDRHRRLNDRFAELGYPTDTIERYVDRVAEWSDRRLSPMTNLALTAALEHHTAIVAETLLGEPDARSLITDDTVRQLFCWHALEESEHKAVAFDLYRALGGSERRRRWTMRAINVTFALEVAMWTGISLMRDTETRRRPVRALRSLVPLLRSPFVTARVLRRLSDYNRPGFHPDDHDTTELIGRWRDELFGPAGPLHDRLAG